MGCKTCQIYEFAVELKHIVTNVCKRKVAFLTYYFRDPIHGFIEVSSLELKIIDSPPFQRLRNIRQLSTTYLVYSGAEHTRFGHSEFVIARYFMFIQVYFHKTRRYLDKLLVENISKILPSSKYPDDVFEYLKWDDIAVLDKIRESSSTNSIAEQFSRRIVMSCVYETPTHSNKERDYKLCKVIKNQLRNQIRV